MSSIKEAVQTLTAKGGVDDLLLCSVVSVDEASRKCIVKTVTGVSDIEIKDVMLMAALDDGVLLTPTVDSVVLVLKSDKVAPHVVLFSELDKITMITGDNSVQLSSGGVLLSGDEYGGLIKIEELVTKINNLESKVDSLVANYNTHIHVTTATVGTGPVGVLTPTTSTETPIGTQTTQADLENETIKHGSGI